jgi:hypothetical protein
MNPEHNNLWELRRIMSNGFRLKLVIANTMYFRYIYFLYIYMNIIFIYGATFRDTEINTSLYLSGNVFVIYIHT